SLSLQQVFQFGLHLGRAAFVEFINITLPIPPNTGPSGHRKSPLRTRWGNNPSQKHESGLKEFWYPVNFLAASLRRRTAVVFPFIIGGLAARADNVWTNISGGKWEDPSWSSGLPRAGVL